MLMGYAPSIGAMSGREALPIQVLGNTGRNIMQPGQASLALGVNGGWQADDFLLLCLQVDNGNTVPTPAGWSLLGPIDYGPFARIYMFFRFKDAIGSVVLNGSGADHITASILGFRNVDRSSPLEASLGYTRPPTSNPYELPGVNTVTPGAYVVYTFAHDAPTNGQVASNWQNPVLGDQVELLDISTDAGWDGGVAAFGGRMAAAGHTGTTLVDVIADVDGICCIVVGLRPAP